MDFYKFMVCFAIFQKIIDNNTDNGIVRVRVRQPPPCFLFCFVFVGWGVGVCVGGVWVCVGGVQGFISFYSIIIIIMFFYSCSCRTPGIVVNPVLVTDRAVDVSDQL